MDKWKVIAIIFITISILEFVLIFFVFSWGLEDIAKENECVYNICSEYDAYKYLDGVCYCYKGNEVAHTEYLN